jgi:hypothetical protein
MTPLCRSYEYGPCIGVTRLQRWERAEALDLNPPFVVRNKCTSLQCLHTDHLYSGETTSH